MTHPLNPSKATALSHLPPEQILVTLQCVVELAEHRAVSALLHKPRDAKPEHVCADLRLDIAGDLTEALDEISPGLGLRLMRALYPEVDFDSTQLDVPPPQTNLFDELNYGVAR